MKRRVLLADDEPAILATLGEVLGQHGFDVLTVSSATSAIEALSAEPFDAVVTDLHMETETAGYRVVEAAARQPVLPAIILVSGYPDLAYEWRRRGAHAYFEKPTALSTLVETIEKLLLRLPAKPRTRGKTA